MKKIKVMNIKMVINPQLSKIESKNKLSESGEQKQNPTYGHHLQGSQMEGRVRMGETMKGL